MSKNVRSVARRFGGCRWLGLRFGVTEIACAALLVLAAAGGAQTGERLFSLLITGAEGVRYTGRCVLTTEAGEEQFEFSGAVPRRTELEGQALACTIESTGWLTVEITQGTSRSRALTNGGTVRVTAL